MAKSQKCRFGSKSQVFLKLMVKTQFSQLLNLKSHLLRKDFVYTSRYMMHRIPHPFSLFFLCLVSCEENLVYIHTSLASLTTPGDFKKDDMKDTLLWTEFISTKQPPTESILRASSQFSFLLLSKHHITTTKSIKFSFQIPNHTITK